MDEKIANFVGMTHASTEVAAEYLERFGGDEWQAVSAFFEANSGKGEGGETTGMVGGGGSGVGGGGGGGGEAGSSSRGGGRLGGGGPRMMPNVQNPSRPIGLRSSNVVRNRGGIIRTRMAPPFPPSSFPHPTKHIFLLVQFG